MIGASPGLPRGRERRDALWRYLPLLLLLVVLGLHSLRTFGTFVVSDDLLWVQRTVADARQPWNAFGEALFGDYYRPIPHLVWLVNYSLWGFNFDGHQFMFIGMWLAGVALVYAVGCRLGGRATGLVVAALVGLNDIYLMISSWKSWTTTLTEYVAALACMWCYLKWLDLRRRRHLIGAAALATLAVLSRELAPLVISSVVLVTAVLPMFRARPPATAQAEPGAPGRKRAVGCLLLWAFLTVAVVAALPSYRSALTEVFSFGAAPPDAAAATEMKEVSSGYFLERLKSHTHSIFSYGLCPYLFLFAILHIAARALRLRGRLAERSHLPVLLVFLFGAMFMAVPWLARAAGQPLPMGVELSARTARELTLLALFVVVSLAASVREHILGVWFVASFVPILFLKHSSNAYHMLAFTALALYVGIAVQSFAAEDLRPVWARLRRRSERSVVGVPAFLLTTVFFVLGLLQAGMLVMNFERVAAPTRQRVLAGRAAEEAVHRAVTGVVQNAAPDRRVWFAGVEGRSYEWLAALILQEEHGFMVQRLDQGDRSLVGLRTFDARLRVYTNAIPFDDAVFRAHNLIPDPGFEDAGTGRPLADQARSGRHSLVANARGTRLEHRKMAIGPLNLRAGGGYVFGGFMRREAERSGTIRMALCSTGADGYAIRTPAIVQRAPRWELLWECASPPIGDRHVEFRAAEIEFLEGGALFVDDVFLCPVAPLIAAARSETAE